MGNETIVTLAAGGERVVARAAAGFSARPGAPVFFSVAKDKVHFFNTETGRLIV
jgi:ABC-type sugar transport system ATPase subunit